MHPKVSVIVPNYNHALYLERRVESILNQTYEDFELILLDDLSTDHSVEILRKYASHPKVSHFIVNEKNSGSPFKQWAKGIELALGEYVWIAESDDWADEKFLEKLVPVLDRHPELGVVYCDSHIVDENEKKLGAWGERKNRKYRTNRWNEDYKNTGKDEVNNYLIFGTVVNNASAGLCRKSEARRLTNEIGDFRFVGDWYYFLNIAYRSGIYYFAEKLNYYRDHRQNTTKSSLGNGKWYLERILCVTNFKKKARLPFYVVRKLAFDAADQYFHILLPELKAAKVDRWAYNKALYQLNPRLSAGIYCMVAWVGFKSFVKHKILRGVVN